MQWAVIKPGSQPPHPRGVRGAVLHPRGRAENTGSWPISLHLLATEAAAHVTFYRCLLKGNPEKYAKQKEEKYYVLAPVLKRLAI